MSQPSWVCVQMCIDKKNKTDAGCFFFFFYNIWLVFFSCQTWFCLPHIRFNEYHQRHVSMTKVLQKAELGAMTTKQRLCLCLGAGRVGVFGQRVSQSTVVVRYAQRHPPSALVLLSSAAAVISQVKCAWTLFSSWFICMRFLSNRMPLISAKEEALLVNVTKGVNVVLKHKMTTELVILQKASEAKSASLLKDDWIEKCSGWGKTVRPEEILSTMVEQTWAWDSGDEDKPHTSTAGYVQDKAENCCQWQPKDQYTNS